MYKGIFIDALGGVRIWQDQIVGSRRIKFPIQKSLKVNDMIELGEDGLTIKPDNICRTFLLVGIAAGTSAYYVYEEEV